LREVGQARWDLAIKNREYLALYDRVFAALDSYMNQKDAWTAQNFPELISRPIAYFSMEFGLHETLPIYSGGLGVLAMII
jgi:starch phosphorylase